jgi:hypothetical protein
LQMETQKLVERYSKIDYKYKLKKIVYYNYLLARKLYGMGEVASFYSQSKRSSLAFNMQLDHPLKLIVRQAFPFLG